MERKKLGVPTTSVATIRRRSGLSFLKKMCVNNLCLSSLKGCFSKQLFCHALGSVFRIFMFFILLEMATKKTRTFKRVHDENECACITFGGTINIFTYTVLVRFVYGKIIYIHIDIYLYYI